MCLSGGMNFDLLNGRPSAIITFNIPDIWQRFVCAANLKISYGVYMRLSGFLNFDTPKWLTIGHNNLNMPDIWETEPDT